MSPASTPQQAGRGPALGLLTRAPEPGRAKTRLAAGLNDRAAAQLAEAFLLDVAAAARAGAWTPVLFVDPPAARASLATLTGITRAKAQGPGEIGARMLAAARALETERFGPLLLIGSDIPTLTPRRLQEAFAALEGADIVFGPAEDGGYYLVGMHRPVPALFEAAALRWGESDVLAASERVARLAGLTSVRIASELDIDTVADLERLCERWHELEEAGQVPFHTERALQALQSRTAARLSPVRRTDKRTRAES